MSNKRISDLRVGWGGRFSLAVVVFQHSCMTWHLGPLSACHLCLYLQHFVAYLLMRQIHLVSLLKWRFRGIPSEIPFQQVWGEVQESAYKNVLRRFWISNTVTWPRRCKVMRVRPCFPTRVPQPLSPSIPKHLFSRFLCNLQGISKPLLPFVVLVFNKWRDLSLNIITGLELLAEGESLNNACARTAVAELIHTMDGWCEGKANLPSLDFSFANCKLQICLPMQETWVQSSGWEDPLEKEMATHSSILACRMPWTEEPGGLQFIGSLQRVGHDWTTKTWKYMVFTSWLHDNVSFSGRNLFFFFFFNDSCLYIYLFPLRHVRLPRCLSGKESACPCKRHKRCGFGSWVRKIPWSRK